MPQASRTPRDSVMVVEKLAAETQQVGRVINQMQTLIIHTGEIEREEWQDEETRDSTRR